jgi:hypothetical protein
MNSGLLMNSGRLMNRRIDKPGASHEPAASEAESL